MSVVAKYDYHKNSLGDQVFIGFVGGGEDPQDAEDALDYLENTVINDVNAVVIDHTITAELANGIPINIWPFVFLTIPAYMLQAAYIRVIFIGGNP